MVGKQEETKDGVPVPPLTLDGCLQYVTSLIEANKNDVVVVNKAWAQANLYAEQAMLALQLDSPARLSEVLSSEGGAVLGRECPEGAYGDSIYFAAREAINNRLYSTALDRIHRLQGNSHLAVGKETKKGLTLENCVDALLANIRAQEARVAELGPIGDWGKSKDGIHLAEAFAGETVVGLGIDWRSLQEVFASDDTLWSDSGRGETLERKMRRVLTLHLAEAAGWEMGVVYEAMAEDGALPVLQT